MRALEIANFIVLIVVTFLVAHCSGHWGLGIASSLALWYLRGPGE